MLSLPFPSLPPCALPAPQPYAHVDGVIVRASRTQSSMWLFAQRNDPPHEVQVVFIPGEGVVKLDRSTGATEDGELRHEQKL